VPVTAFTESGTYAPSVTKIADGDDVNAATTNTPLQALVDRSKYFKDLLDGGVQKAQVAADAAAVRALTTHANGSICAIADGKLFVYNPSSSATDDGVLVIKPTDVGGGAGRWINPAYHLLSRENTWSSLQHFAAVLATSVSTTGGGTIASDGDLTAGGDCAIVGTAYVGGACTLVGIVTCSTDLNVGGDLDVTGGVHAGGASLFSSTCTVSGAMLCSSSLAVGGALTVSTTLGVTGVATFASRIEFSGSGTVRWRTVEGSTSATHTYYATDADEIIVTAMSADRTYTLSDTSALAGHRVRFVNTTGTYNLSIDTAQGNVAILRTGAGTRTVELLFFAGEWRNVQAN
jgi:hypothetical protein